MYTHTTYKFHSHIIKLLHTSGPVYGLDVDKSSEQSELVFRSVSVPQVNQNFQNLG